jgi:hypothetical protein
MKSLICETRNVVSAAVLRNIVLASPGNYPIRGLEGYDGIERREKGERRAREGGDVQYGGIYSLCSLEAVLDGSLFPQCKTGGSSLLSWGRHLRRART